MKLFPDDKIIGIFRGFSEGGLEFHADLILPYRSEFQSTPMHGQFVLVQLESEDEAVLGRITSLSAQGRLVSSAGEDYGIRAVADDRPIPEDLREQYLRYKVNIRVLGVVRVRGNELVFAASHRRLPHVGSKVAFLSDAVLKEIAGHNLDGAELGFLALGEFIFAGDDQRLEHEPWMQINDQAVVPRFSVNDLVARRSFVFARAGFGKSNLVKLLFSNLYRGDPTTTKRGGSEVPVGTVLFDPEGEYFWPDDRDRPGLCDVSELKNKLVVFTDRKGPSEFYRSFVVSGIKLDIRRLSAADVLSVALPIDRQEQQNVQKLKGLNPERWRKLVDAIYINGHGTDEGLIQGLLQLGTDQRVETVAARANMTRVVRELHDPSSQMLDILVEALRHGKLCIVDISQLRGAPGLRLSGIILKYIFDRNQSEFTSAQPKTIPTIAVLEEAQSVLGNTPGSSDGPYVSWVKEGRKYDLGAVLITQQPASIQSELLSQGDNWFVFHLLSAGDLQAVKRANAHFSDDILSALLNEPIPGHGVFWSSASGKSYPIPIRALSFEHSYQTLDPEYEGAATDSYAREIRDRFNSALRNRQDAGLAATVSNGNREEPSLTLVPEFERMDGDLPPDAFETYVAFAINALRDDEEVQRWLTQRGEIPWMGLQAGIMRGLPNELDDHEKNKMARDAVRQAMDTLYGVGSWDFDTREKKSGPGTTTWIVLSKED